MHLTEQAVAIPGDKAIEEKRERPHQRDFHQREQDSPSLQTRQQGEKSIQPPRDRTVLGHQKGDVRTTRLVGTAQSPRCFLALIGHKPDRLAHAIFTKTLQPFFRGDTEAAVPVINQKTLLF